MLPVSHLVVPPSSWLGPGALAPTLMAPSGLSSPRNRETLSSLGTGAGLSAGPQVFLGVCRFQALYGTSGMSEGRERD